MDDRDMQQLIDMLERAGIGYTTATEPEGWGRDGEPVEGVSAVVKITADGGPMNLGYSGFLTEFGFDADGNLKTVGCWE